MKLHIGCGKKYLKGYTHIDIYPFPHIDIVHDISHLSEIFKEGEVDEIYACHVFEHFKRNEIEHVLCDWNHVLCSGGILRLAVPDFQSIAEHYLEHKDISQLLGLLYGGQTNPYNFHYITFDFESLKQNLEKTGFDNIQRYDTHEFLPHEFDDYSKAYLPHMDQNGKLMSLNIRCTKK